MPACHPPPRKSESPNTTNHRPAFPRRSWDSLACPKWPGVYWEKGPPPLPDALQDTLFRIHGGLIRIARKSRLLPESESATVSTFSGTCTTIPPRVAGGIDWLCPACVREKREEWADIWARVDGWLDLGGWAGSLSSVKGLQQAATRGTAEDHRDETNTHGGELEYASRYTRTPSNSALSLYTSTRPNFDF
ncbi:hypothetical protein BJ138DRAFT_1224641 [Hygrophoropsis aurantiaca]|uniref:Uncharacterized protein n=1 Tax=Hygrophoropsis aurantiaca TaxID=72124 RepID=A0ACB7ZZ54_9AGAM|nr:hypothetical protein BJ138DRAFT_1224641 [Hygrophoropsis aurantiaca]